MPQVAEMKNLIEFLADKETGAVLNFIGSTKLMSLGAFAGALRKKYVHSMWIPPTGFLLEAGAAVVRIWRRTFSEWMMSTCYMSPASGAAPENGFPVPLRMSIPAAGASEDRMQGKYLRSACPLKGSLKSRVKNRCRELQY
jgi:hypothetical protein